MLKSIVELLQQTFLLYLSSAGKMQLKVILITIKITSIKSWNKPVI